MYQSLDERFYQATKYYHLDENTEVIANRFFNTMKSFCVLLVLSVLSND